jgi:hypothetical protein
MGGLLVALAVVSGLLGRHGYSIARLVALDLQAELRRDAQENAGVHRIPGRSSHDAWLLAAICLGLLLRLRFIGQPMRFDESIGYLTFVNGEFLRAFFYPVPNNHVLHTLLQKLACWVIGASPAAIRLPAFLSGLALIPASYALSRRLEGGSGLIAAFGAAIMPYMVLYSTNGRGYTLQCLLVLLVAYTALSRNGPTFSGRWCVPAVLSALGMLTMPSMLYAIAGLALWIAGTLLLQPGKIQRTLRFLACYAAATAILTFLFYTPVVLVSGGWGSVLDNKYVRPLPPDRFLTAIVPHLGDIVHDWNRDVPLLLAIAIAALAVLGILASRRGDGWARPLLLPAMLIGAALVFVFKLSIPFVRTWTYLIPFILIAADGGFSFVCARLPVSLQKACIPAIAAGAAAFVFKLGASGAVVQYPDTGSFASAATVATELASVITIDDVVCAEQPVDAPVAYYLLRDAQPHDYRSRPSLNRRFFVHDGPAADVEAARSDGATLVMNTDRFAIYDLRGQEDQPSMLARANCWSPAREAGLQ